MHIHTPHIHTHTHTRIGEAGRERVIEERCEDGVVNVEEGSEQSIASGDKGPEPVDELGVSLKIPIRNYGNESNYLYGIKAGAPRVMKLLEKFGFQCTFTAAAVAPR